MFEEKKFNIGKLKGISEKTIEEHLKLYVGYVKHANLIQAMIEQYGKVEDEGGKYSVAEITRRFSFEFNGMRNHEVYFNSLSGEKISLSKESNLAKSIEVNFGSFESWLLRFKAIALNRGVGWAILYFDPLSKKLLNAWVDEQHLGQLQECRPIIALDMWEHSYVADYQPSGKKQYVEDFFENLNWKVIEDSFNGEI
jgi:Fe-Mn family superoxide dismutase